ncbi:hypothetical protein ABZ612_35450 [Streptomyces avermitilis]|uniref:hypothetical protein n=1 Tax=Streptomyces avermitilis TaxID=33903 RepID=UPI0033FF1AB1
MADRVTGVRAREVDGVSGDSGCGALRRVVGDDDGEGVRPDAGSEVTIHARRPEATTATRQTAEGVKSCRAILDLSRVHGVEMPITEVVAAVIDGTTSVPDAVAALMSRTPKPEQYSA